MSEAMRRCQGSRLWVSFAQSSRANQAAAGIDAIAMISFAAASDLGLCGVATAGF